MDYRYREGVRSKRSEKSGKSAISYKCSKKGACVDNEADLAIFLGVKKLTACSQCDLLRECTGIVRIDPATFFDQVLVINLERRSDRRELIKDRLKDWPYAEPKFVVALDGQTHPKPDHFDQGPYAWACGQSHLKAIKEAYDAGANRILILEDDVILREVFREKSIEFLSQLPANWEIAWLGGEHRQLPRRIKPGIVRSVSTDRLHAYALSRDGMKKLITIWENWKTGHCDWHLNKHLHEFQSFAPEQWLAGQGGGVSDINGQAKPIEWFDVVKPPGEGATYKPPFERAFVINLKFHEDRLKAFGERIGSYFGKIEVFRAIYGDGIYVPEWWSSGKGAWGCYRSHLQILEKCFSENVESYVVFEDDAIFKPNTVELMEQFLAELPDDWEQAYLGGQLLAADPNGGWPPKQVSQNVLIPFNVNRTHAFAIHRRGYEKLYKHLLSTPFTPNMDGSPSHIDHHFGHLQEKEYSNPGMGIKCYVPAQWICGQAAGKSAISGQHNGDVFWPDPLPKPIVPAAVPKQTVGVLKPVKNVAPIILTEGVGTEVKKILKSIGVDTNTGCQACEAMINRMNHWGPCGCREEANRKAILAQLNAKRKEAKNAEKWTAAFGAIRTGLFLKLNPIDPIPGIVDEACRIVEERLNSPRKMTDREWLASRVPKRLLSKRAPS